MSKLLRCFCLFSVICSVLTWGLPADAHGSELKVRILLYSGRPDPVFTVKDSNLAQARSFMQKAGKAMLRSEAKVSIPSTLGYKGMLVENSGRLEGLPEQFFVYNGKVQGVGKQKALYSDAGRNFEKFLLKEGVKQKAISDKMLMHLKVDEMR